MSEPLSTAEEVALNAAFKLWRAVYEHVDDADESEGLNDFTHEERPDGQLYRAVKVGALTITAALVLVDYWRSNQQPRGIKAPAAISIDGHTYIKVE